MGVKPKLAEAFLNNHAYTPQEETYLIGALEGMQNVKGRDAYIALASLTREEDMAVFYRLQAQMMEAYHLNVAPAVGILNVGGDLRLEKKDGTFLALQPLDYIFWTKEIQGLLETANSDMENLPQVSGKELWISGKLDPKVREMLTATGWKFQENAKEILFKKK